MMKYTPEENMPFGQCYVVSFLLCPVCKSMYMYTGDFAGSILKCRCGTEYRTEWDDSQPEPFKADRHFILIRIARSQEWHILLPNDNLGE